MTRFCLSTATSLLSLLFVASALPAQTPDAAPSSPGLSKVRIVRLSEVKGVVQADVAKGEGYVSAMNNLPIVENMRLRTDDGVAEVEFEDNSTLRLAPDSEVEFPQLERLATGGTLSTVHVISGTVYVSLLKSPQDQFTVLFGRDMLTLPPGSHVRLNVGVLEASLAVLDGTAHIDGPFGALDIPRKKTATFVWTDPGAPALKKDIAAETFDSWDKDASGYHARVANASAFGNSPYAYGLNDMMYYGSFMDAGGCGMMWRPYFASAAWDPYANGAWAYYQGAGYSWVSPYPWGWTPYHSGSWAFCPGTGWGWRPGSNWYGLNNASTMIASNAGGGAGATIRPHPPTAPPRAGHPIITPVNLRPLPVSGVNGGNAFFFRRDSAGMGIPRQGLGKLGGFSRSTISHGVAATPVYMENGPARNPGMMRGGPGNTVRPVNTLSNMGAIHRGYGPGAGPAMPGGPGMNGGFHSSVGMGPNGSMGGGMRPTPAGGPSMGAHPAGPPAGGGGPVAAPRGH